MPPRKRFKQSASPLQGDLTPAGHWILSRVKGTSVSLPLVASYCGLSYSRFSSIISGKLIPPYNFARMLVDVFYCPEELDCLRDMIASFKTSRSVSAMNRAPREPCGYIVRRKKGL